MKRLVLIVSLMAAYHLSFAQEHFHKEPPPVERDKERTQEKNTGTTERETKEMRASNERFRQTEAAKPAEDRSYKNTKEYKSATPEQQKAADQRIELMNKVLEHEKAKQQQEKSQPAPAPSPKPTPEHRDSRF